jgi:DNA-binding NarL/FixJ family response regulator
MATIRVLLVDDQPLLRQGLRVLLQLESDMAIVGEASNGQEAVMQTSQLHPDVVLMDIRMPGMDGVAATAQICRNHPQTKVLILTTFDHDDYVTAALQQGAVGYLLKDTPSDELAIAIRAIHKGYSQFSPGILQKMISGTRSGDRDRSTVPPEVHDLTRRERDVLQQLAQGANNREIAQRLYISEGTVKNHITHILARLNLRDRTQAALFAQSILPCLEDKDSTDSSDPP